MAKKKKKEDVLSEQIPLDEAIVAEPSEEISKEVSEEKIDTSAETKKKKEKKVSRKQKKAAKKKASAEDVDKKADEKEKETAEEGHAEKETKKETKKKPSEEPTPIVEDNPPKKKKQSKKSTKKKEESKVEEKSDEKTEVKIEELSETEEKSEVKTDKNAESPKEEETPVKEILVDEKTLEKTVEETAAPKKKKQSKKSSKKKSEDLKLDNQSVEELLTVDVDSEKATALNEAFAEIENQLKELEKGADATAKEGKKRGRKKKTETRESPVEESPVEPHSTADDVVTDVSPVEPVVEETPKKSFMKEFTIQLNKSAIKEETLGEPLADEFYIKHDDSHEFSIPDKISEEKAEELTLFGSSSEDESEKVALKEPAEKDTDSSEDVTKSLPSLGKLQDIKGEEIDDFIEPLEYFGDEEKPKLDLEEQIEPAGSNIKPLPRFLSHFVPVQGDGVAEIVRKGFVVICIVLLLVSMGILIDSTRKDDMKTDESDKSSLNSYSENFAINQAASNLPEGVLEKYHSLYNVNNDMVGWLTLPGTPIDMPVVQYVDNEFYETTDFNGNDLVGLVAYADSTSYMNTLGRKTILYVASGENYGPISGVDKYSSLDSDKPKKDSFTLSFGTLYGDYEWEIIAGILTSDIETAISKLSVEDFSEFSEYVLNETVYPRSLVNIKSGDKTLMLSIPYTDGDTENTNSNTHLVLIAKLLNQQTHD